MNASNLIGTEMLGAFTGLTHLLREKRRSNDIQADESVGITVATDGRPERRPWWDNRGDDSSGVPIPLPDSLGGDEITAAGFTATTVPFNTTLITMGLLSGQRCRAN